MKSNFSIILLSIILCSCNCSVALIHNAGNDKPIESKTSKDLEAMDNITAVDNIQLDTGYKNYYE